MTLPALYRPTPPTIATDIGLTLDGWAAGTMQDEVVDSQGTEWWIVEDGLEGWNGTPDVRLSGQARPQEHGENDAASWYGSRVITVRGLAICTDKTAALLAMDIISSVAAWNPSGLSTLQVSEPGRPTRQAQVRLNSATKVGSFNGLSFDWQLQLKAPDPRRYDDTETVVVLSPPSGAVGGLALPATVPFALSTDGMSTSSATLVNDGTFSTAPVVTFAGPLIDPQIAHVGKGKSLNLSITLVSGDTLVADFDRRTLILNGSASRTSTLMDSAAWWDLDPGGNDIAYTAGGGDGTATVRYRNAFL